MSLTENQQSSQSVLANLAGKEQEARSHVGRTASDFHGLPLPNQYRETAAPPISLPTKPEDSIESVQRDFAISNTVEAGSPKIIDGDKPDENAHVQAISQHNIINLDEIDESNLALYTNEKHEIFMENSPPLSLGPNECVVRVRANGICGYGCIFSFLVESQG